MSQIPNNKHYEYYKELLSCLNDGELSNLELEELIQAIPQYPELRAYWSRLQLKNNVLKASNIAQLSKLHLANKVNDLLSEEAKILAFPQPPININEVNTKWSAFTNFAIAASVMFVVMTAWLGSQSDVREAALAFLLPQQYEKPIIDTNINTQFAVNRNASSKVLASSGNISKAPSQSVNDLYLSEDRIQDYMMLHAEHASLNTNQGLLPFARMSQVSTGSQF